MFWVSIHTEVVRKEVHQGVSTTISTTNWKLFEDVFQPVVLGLFETDGNMQ